MVHPTTEASRAAGFVVWLTGLSGAGKTTLAEALALRLRARGERVEVLDGDEVREHLGKGLTFSREDRDLNVARIAFVASLLARNGVIVLVAAISPYRAAREAARARVGAGAFVEIHVAPPREACVRRDTKGLYRRALAGELQEFTGVNDPYEAPEAPALAIDTSVVDPDAALDLLERRLVALGHLPAPPNAGAPRDAFPTRPEHV